MKKTIGFVLCLLFCAAAFGLTQIYAAESRVSFDELSLPETAEYGSWFTLPEVEIDVGGQLKPAKTTLIRPSGSRTTDRSVTLSEAGKYVLEFTAEANGKSYTETCSFRVDYPAFTLNATAGTVTYGAHASAPSASGLVVDVKTGGSISFNKVVDVSSLTKSDVLFEMFVTPENVGRADFNSFSLVLTDAYDADNYVTIAAVNQSANADQYSYIKAGSARQSLTGVEIWQGAEKVHVNDYYGTPVRVTFFGAASPATNKFTLSMDYATRTIYCNGERVVDLDSVAYFSDLWEGFTTGDVRLSFRPSEGTNARCVITNIYGMDLEATTVTDTQAPRLSIDYGEYTADSLPTAQAKKPYRLFEAYALDSYAGECEVTREVYLNYYSSNPVKFYLSDGAFTPSRGGTYTAVYSAVDRFGNRSELIFDISAKSALPEMEIDVSSLSVSNCKAGLEIVLDSVQAMGGSGNKTVEFTVAHAQGESAYRLTERGFRPLLTGNYTVTFTATDYVGNTVSQDLVIEVGENRDPQIEEEAALPQCLLEGFTYTLPSLEAINYFNGVSTVSSVITVTDANGTVQLEGNRYTPAVANDGDEVTIVYTATTTTGAVSRTYQLPCYQVKTEDSQLDMTRYFRTDGEVSITPQANYTVFKFSKAAEVRYLNSLLWPGFEMTCRVQSTAGRAVFVFADSANPADVFEMALAQRNGKVYLLSGDQEFETVVSFDKNFTIRYDGTLNKLFLDNVGYEPAGLKLFSSGKVNFSWRLEELKSSADFRLIRLNQQTVNNSTQDLVAPQVSLLGSSGGCYAPGSVVTTLIAVWGDVLDPDTSCLLTVRDPNGEIVTSMDGVRLENVSPLISYRILLEYYGVYAVEYIPQDSSGNSMTFYDRFRVWDSTPPTVAVSGVPASASVNRKIVLPAAQVSDDFSQIDSYFVAYFAPDGCVHYVSAASGERSFVPEQKGVYRVVYYCFDLNGNMGSAEFTITVS